MTREVTPAEFWAAMGPRDVIPTPERHFSVWKTRAGAILGYTLPGYLFRGRRQYFLGPDLPAQVEENKKLSAAEGVRLFYGSLAQ